MVQETSAQLSRVDVYRYIFKLLQDDSGRLPQATILDFVHHLICSPRVSRAILAYQNAKYMPAARLGDQNVKIIQEGMRFDSFLNLVESIVRENYEFHRNVPKALDDIVEAMCWELETTREEFLGPTGQ